MTRVECGIKGTDEVRNPLAMWPGFRQAPVMDDYPAASSLAGFRELSRSQQWTVVCKLQRDSPALRTMARVILAMKLTLAAIFLFCIYKPVVEVEKGLALLVYLALAHAVNEVVWRKVQRPAVEKELAAREMPGGAEMIS